MTLHLFIFLVISLLLNTCAEAQDGKTTCDKDTMNMCRRNIENVLSGYGDAKELEPEDQCWRIRRNFDCVLWQTSMCLKQDEQRDNRDIIVKGWQFLDTYCEKFRNWWTKTCFRTNKMSRCENMLGSKSRSTDYSSCRSYLRFRDCAISTIQNDCSTDDKRLLGVYLMEKGQQRAWNCPKDSESYSHEPVNAPYASSGRETSYDDLGMLGDSPGISCITNAPSAIEKCQAKHEEVKAEVADLVDEDARKKKICCSVFKFMNCVEDELRPHCGDTVVDMAKTAVTTLQKASKYNCILFDKARCSGPMSAVVTHGIIIAGVFMYFIITAFL